MKKVMFVSSSGGHFDEILKLETLFSKYEYILVTEKTDTTLNYKDKLNIQYLKYGSRQYFLKYIFVFLYNIFKSIYLLIKYSPKIVITTGAHTGGIVSLIAKILNKKVIYIESIAKVNTLSVTGKFVYKFADRFFVQWEELAELYTKAEYLGRMM